MTDDLRITTDVRESSTVLRLDGDLDVATVALFRDAVERADLQHSRQLVLDVTEVSYCDSSGITALLATRNRTIATGHRLTLEGVPTHMTRMFRVVGLDQVFGLDPTAG
ncbi:STAS domain-containing protein [Pseudonocardia spinosispora]|uniref:STAS domain-containing protein n=1 Tax=Pseudonocardia spinosispora TaxID=103441 RepID=UPI00041847B1|nr:STAS domain-containing protein [Pseudonocardia spinosispora]